MNELNSMLEVEIGTKIEEPPAGILNPSVLDIYFTPNETSGEKIIHGVVNGDPRSTIFSTLLIKTLSYLGPYKKDKTYKALVLKKGIKSTKSPASYITKTTKSVELKNMGSMPFDKGVFSNDPVESWLYKREVRGDHISYLSLINGVSGEQTYGWRWETVNASRDVVIALSQILEIEREENEIISLIYDPSTKKYYINPTRAINPESIPNGRRLLEKVYNNERKSVLKEAERFFRYSTNLMGKVKEIYEKRKINMRHITRDVICDRGIVEEIGGLKEGSDYKNIGGDLSILKLGTFILSISRKEGRGIISLSYDGTSIRYMQENGRLLRRINLRGSEKPGDINVMFSRESDKLNVVYSYGILPDDKDDMFLSTSESYLIKKITDKTYLLTV